MSRPGTSSPAVGLRHPVQTNMASTLNLDWLLHVASDLLNSFGCEVDHARLVQHIDRWLSEAKPGALLYHPISPKRANAGRSSTPKPAPALLA